MNITTKRLIKLQGKRTLREFSDQVGIGQSTLHNYLHGREMKAPMIRKVCKATMCSADWLLGLKEGKVGDAEIKLGCVRMHLEADVIEKKKLIKQMEV